MKKWLCVLLVVLVCALPVLALAKVHDLSDPSKYFKSDSKYRFTEVIRNGDTITGTAPFSGIDYTGIEVEASATITFDEVKVTDCFRVFSQGGSGDKLTVKLKGDNVISDSVPRINLLNFDSSVAFIAEEGASLTLRKSHSISSNASDAFTVEGSLIINGGTFNITSDVTGIASAGQLILNGGDVNVNAGNDGIISLSQPEVNGGTLNVTVPDDGQSAAVRAYKQYDDRMEFYPVRLGRPANLPGFAGWNVNGAVMQPGDTYETAWMDNGLFSGHSQLSITPIISATAAAPAAASALPQTGDSTNLLLLSALALISLTGALVLGRKARKTM